MINNKNHIEKSKWANPPLVESIFELRWQIPVPEKGLRGDPNYKIIVGRFYDQLEKNFLYEPLNSAFIPDNMIEGIVQHRFKKSDQDWPIIQLGHGILSANHSESYTWEEFEQNASKAVNTFYDVYPNIDDLKIKRLVLRYINAHEFDFEKSNVFEFMKDNLSLGISIGSDIFDKIDVNSLPSGFSLSFAYPSVQPEGNIHLVFSRAKKRGKEKTEGLVWEIFIESLFEKPMKPSEILKWINDSHKLIQAWFRKSLSQELLQRFV